MQAGAAEDVARASPRPSWSIGRLDWRTLDSRTYVIVFALALVGLYAVLRTLNAPDGVLLAWTAMAAVFTLVSVVGGLTVLAALGPFTEALTDDGRITAVPFLLAALGVGLLLSLARMAIARRLPRPPLPIVIGGVLFVGTLLSVGLSALNFGPARGYEALQLWVPGIGGGLTVLFAAWLVARNGEYRPLVVVVTSVTLAAAVSLLEELVPGVVGGSVVGWLLRPDAEQARLTGIIPAPNSAAIIFLAALPLTAAGILSAKGALARLLAAGASVILLVAIVLTYSRSGLIALPVIAGVLAWHYLRWTGLLVISLAAGAVGIAATAGLGIVRDVPVWADEARLAAWSAGIQMWADQPWTGHGFRSFEWLHLQYGAMLDAPHNEWLRFFAEAGFVVGLSALAFVAAAAAVLTRARHWLAAAGAAALGALFVMAAFNNPLMYVQVNVPAFLAVGMAIGAAIPADADGPRANSDLKAS